jgi:CRP/FNR family transcriptional regulator
MHAVAAIPAAPIHIHARRAPLADAFGAAPVKTLCSTCHLKDLCLPSGQTCSVVERLDTLLIGRRRVKEGEVLYRAGQNFQYIYAVRSGTFKSSLTLKDGREQVTGFQMAGELMGLDGLAEGRYASSAIALEDAEICAIPYSRLSELAAGTPDMLHVISRLMSREIVREHSLMMLLGSMNAEERLSVFLLNLSRRMKERGFSATEFHLRMSRAEIASYLGLKVETISRTFSLFQQQGMLVVDKKHVRILDLERLASALELRVH